MYSTILPIYLLGLAKLVLLTREFDAQAVRLKSRATAVAAEEAREVRCAKDQRRESCRARLTGSGLRSTVIFRRSARSAEQGVR
ncbi:MAG: hypothetical protein RIQ81_367 [Pseudomonadota bacterium]|jgi:hypothetical protein